MILDAILNFVTPGYPLSIVGATGTDIPSPGIIDILGAGVGQPPPSIIGAQASGIFGPAIGGFGSASGMGVGQNRLLIQCTMGVAAATSTSATLNVALQGAPDTGTAGGNQPGTWSTFVESGPIAASVLVAGLAFAKLDMSPAFQQNSLPRFLRLLFKVASGTSFTAGTIANAFVTFDRDDLVNVYAAKNFIV